jgi:hypothetical protein
MKKELILKIIEDLKNEGWDVEWLVSEDGIMNGNYGEMSWSDFDSIEDSELRLYIEDIILENNIGDLVDEMFGF